MTRATTATDPREGVTIKNAGGFSLAEAVAAPPTSPVAAIPEAFTAAFGAPPTPVVKEDIKEPMPPQADAAPKAEAPAPPKPSETKTDAAVTAEVPAPVAEAPATAAPPKPSPTKPPAIKPVMPGGRKKSKNNKKKKKGSKK